jgi:iron complex outermembrane recepter protein
MKKISLMSLFLLFILKMNAQSSLNGVLRDEKKEPLGFGTVLLLKSVDSSFLKSALSAENGTYLFEKIEAGNYILKATFIGFSDIFSEKITVSSSNITIPDLQFKQNSTNLKEVTITFRKPVVEVKADKTILNVEGTINSTGLNSLELIRKAPGVTVDNNDNIAVKGKNAVKIMVDGRDLPLDGKDLSAFLKSTQAADIASIEIISNPSARYDAAGNAGIINIRMKKNKTIGTNGNVGSEFTMGKTPKFGSNVSLNTRNKRSNIFGSYNNYIGDWAETHRFYREQSGYVFDQNSVGAWKSRYNGGRLGADLFLNDKNTIGVLANGGYNSGGSTSDSRTSISQQTSRTTVDSSLVAQNFNNIDQKNVNFNLNYRFADTSGHSLNIDLDRGYFRHADQSDQPNNYFLGNGNNLLKSLLFKTRTPADIDIMTAKTDYEQRFLKGTLGIGAKISDVKTDNNFNFFNAIDNTDILDKDRSNRFKYKETTTAGYVNYNRGFGKKINLQAGLRVENTDYKGTLISQNAQNGQEVSNNYTKLFPSAAITYSFSEKLGMNGTYSRRIDRPSYSDLNPFESKLDELTFQKGNPFLRPQFTNSFEIAPTYMGYPVFSVGYSHTKDVFTQVLGRDKKDDRATFITQENLADQKNWTLSLNAPTPIKKWWDGFVSLTGVRSQYSSTFDTLSAGGAIKVNVAFATLNGYVEQNFKLGHGFALQASGWFNTPSYWGVMRAKAMGSFDFGASKKCLGDRGEFRVRVSDIFRTSGWRGTNEFTPGLVFIGNGYNENRNVTVNFSYRFGRSEIKASRSRKTGLEDEKNRVKSGKS